MSNDKGRCCTSPLDCPYTEDSLCSYNTKTIGLAYYTCPRDASICGSRENIRVLGDISNPEVFKMDSRQIGASFKDQIVCRYRLDYPIEAEIYDELTVRVKKIENAVAYVSDALSFSDKDAH